MHSDVNPLHKVFAADFFSMQHVILEGDKDNIGWQKILPREKELKWYSSKAAFIWWCY